MPPRKKPSAARPGSPGGKSSSNGPGSVKPVRSSRKKTLSPKAAAGVEDGIKPAHLTSLPKSRPLPPDGSNPKSVKTKATAPSSVDSEPEDADLEFDSEAEFFSSPTKSQGHKGQTSSKGGKRKLALDSDSSDGARSERLATSPKKRKKGVLAASRSSKARPDVTGSAEDAPSPAATPSKKKRASVSHASSKKQPIMKLESDSEADGFDAVMSQQSDSASVSHNGDEYATRVNLIDPTESDMDFIVPDADADEFEGSASEGAIDSDAGLGVEDPKYDSENGDEEEEDEDAGVLALYSKVDEENYDLTMQGDTDESDDDAPPPSSVTSSPKKRVRMKPVVEMDDDSEEEVDVDGEELLAVRTPSRSIRQGSAGRRSAPTTPKSSGKTKGAVSPRTPRQTAVSKPSSASRTSSGVKASSSGSVRKEVGTPSKRKDPATPVNIATPSKSDKGRRKDKLSIKEQGVLSPHKDNTSTRSCHITSSKIIDKFLADSYRDLYPLKPVSIASAAGVEVLMTPFSWLTDGTYSNKPINTQLLKDVITFAECGDLPFINPARYPPSRLQGVQTNSVKTSTFNLATKGLSMGPVCCITFGTVVDSHLFHPRIPKTSATHSITIFPFKGEWERSLACIGNALGEDTFSHYIHVGGVTFQGTWNSSPSKEETDRWEEEQAGYPLPVYVPPKNPPVVASNNPSGKPGPGQAHSSGRGLVGRGPPSINYGTKIPVFDCTHFFQPRRAGEFASIRSLSDLFAQAGEDVCPQIVGEELRLKSIVAVCYTASKWRGDDSPNRFNLGLNVRGVYLMVNGKKE